MDLFYAIVLFVLTGVLAGISAGLLGIGGGIVVVPLLFIIFLHQGASITIAMHTAIGTSLAIMIITAIASAVAHAKRKAVWWPLFLRLLPGIIVGAIVGALIANALPGNLLKKIFAVFLLFASIQMAFQFLPIMRRSMMGWFPLSTFGLISGAISSGLGKGGGVINVPFFVMNDMNIREAIGTAAALGLPIAISGTGIFLYSGMNEANLLPYSLGFINIPVLITVSIVTLFTASLGAYWAHQIRPHILRWVFAAFLFAVAISLFFKN